MYPHLVDSLAAHRSSVRTNRYQHIIVDLASEQSSGRLITLRCEGPDEFKSWMDALTAQLSNNRSEAATTATEVKLKKRDLSVSSSLSSHSLSSVAASVGSAKSLAPLLSNQKAFLSYVFEISVLSPFFPSNLPTPAAFLIQTPATFLRRRHPSLLIVEAELSKYEQLLSSLSYLWNETRLVMVDELEQSGSGQIGFSFPGFDTQVFDVGRLSVVCSGQLLPAPSLEVAHALTFTQHDFHSAIDSSSPLKEMMTQASPDLTSRLNSSSPSTRHAAKLLSASVSAFAVASLHDRSPHESRMGEVEERRQSQLDYYGASCHCGSSTTSVRSLATRAWSTCGIRLLVRFIAAFSR